MLFTKTERFYIVWEKTTIFFDTECHGLDLDLNVLIKLESIMQQWFNCHYLLSNLLQYRIQPTCTNQLR